MSTNDQIILNDTLDQYRREIAPELSDSAYFEIFTSEQILKDFDLSYDEIISGIVDGGGDGGIDSLYLLINGEHIVEDTEFDKFKGDISIELHIIQSKASASFKEHAVEKLISSTGDLLDLSKDIKDLEGVYNDEILNVIGTFRDIYRRFARRFPKLTISYYYATKGDTQNLHPNVERKVQILKESVSRFFSSAEFSFKFLGAGELLQLARRSPIEAYSLKLAENPISTGKANYVCLSQLKDYYEFITDSQGKMIKGLFEANVRDYQGDVEVNKGIQNTLKNPCSGDFWWLNNGITMIASDASVSGKTITIKSPQIVNGLQTSEEIYKYFKELSTEANDERNLLVRVIIPTEPEIRDRIIKATNSQTRIPTASLRATDSIHRDIEDFLKSHGYYYDRRKNYYKNEGKPINRIISISYLAQAVMSIVLKQPDYARARPSSLMKKDDDYKRIFSTDYPVQLYLKCIEIMKLVEDYIRHNQDIPSEHVNNVKFHMAMFSTLVLAKTTEINPDLIIGLDLSDLNDETLDNIFKNVFSVYKKLGYNDQVAKNRDFVQELIYILDELVR
jgi:hypothetical protein